MAEDKFKALIEQLDAGAAIVNARMAAIKEQKSRLEEEEKRLELYGTASALVANVSTFKDSSRTFENLNPRNAVDIMIRLHRNYEGISGTYNTLRNTYETEKSGKKGIKITKGVSIGRDYFEAIAPEITKISENIGHILGLYFDEITEELGGSKLYNDMLSRYKHSK